jgi:DNA-binding CsgD family transcriptional regulator
VRCHAGGEQHLGVLGVSGAAVLWEREAVSAAIAGLLERAAVGGAGALFIIGDAGLGKTALVGQACRLAADRGFLVGSGRGDPMEASLPFGLFVQAFTELGGAGILRERGSELAGSDARGARFYGALQWLGTLGGGPALLALDDLHWADADSLSLLSFLCRRLGSLKVAVIAALRSWPAEADGLAARLASDGSARCQRLAPLGAVSAARLLAARLGRKVGAEEAERAWEISAGNPLLLEQLALMAGRGEQIPGRTGAGAHTTAAGLLLARFAGLPAAGMRCAQAAAVLGDSFRAELAPQLAQLSDAEADVALEALDRSGLVLQTAAGSLRFVHPLFRQALYDDLGAAQRGLLHARAFTLLADRGLDAEAAEHAIQAGLAGDPQAISLLERVGRSALRAGALETAVTVLQAAAGLAGEHATAGLLASLADALTFADRPAEAAHACNRALSRPGLQPMTRAGVLRRLARALVYTGAFPAAADRFEESIVLTAQADPGTTVRTYLAYGLAAWLCAGPRQAHRVMTRARQATRPYDHALRRQVDAAWAYSALETGDPRGLELAKAAACSVESDPSSWAVDARSAWGALITYANTAKYTERLAESDHFYRVALQAAEQAGAVGTQATVAIARTETLTRQLRIAEAAQMAERGARLTELVPLAGPLSAATRAGALLQAGRLQDSEACISGAEPTVKAIGAWSAWLWLSYFRGWRLVAEGRFAEASQVYAGMEAMTRRVGLGEPCEVPWAGHAIAAYVGCGRQRDALRVISWLDGCARRLPCRWPRIAAATGRARLAEAAGDHSGADAYFREALDLYSQTDLPMERLQTLLEYGRILRRSGEPTRARPLLAQAHQLATDGGAVWLASQASQELKVAGGRRRSRAEPGALTPQEQRVAELAAARLSNKEIANRLYVSVKTIEAHLQRIYAKLGIHSRKELLAVSSQPEPPSG